MTDKPDMIDGSVLQEAYKRRFEEMVGLTELARPTMDASTAITIGMGARRHIAAHRADILKLHTIDAQLVNSVEDYLYAFAHSHALYLIATTPVGSVPELAAQLGRARDILVSTNVALEKLGLMEAMPAKQSPGPLSHSDLALDVLARTAAYRAAWANIQSKTGIQLGDLEAWETASARMLHALGERALPEQDQGSASLHRQRAFTLFLRAYDEVRDALAFLRRKHDDVDELVPSLYTARTTRRKRSDAADESEDSEANPGAGGQSGAPAAEDPESPFRND